MSELSLTRKLLYGFVTVLGFSFWFFLGYPFANHNESFVIVTQLDRMTLGDVLTERIYPVANYRPLGQMVAWLGYRLGGDTVSGVQLFNYVVTVFAWLLLSAALRERRVFSYAALAVGGTLFSGYIYLFHLHGVFYSPLLVVLAVLFLLETRKITSRLLWAVALTALIAAFFHPYALPIYLAALIGFVLERPREFGSFRSILVWSLVSVLALLVFMVILPSHERAMSAGQMLSGLVTSYRMVEVNAAVSAAVFVLIALTVWSSPAPRKVRWGLMTAAMAGTTVVLLLGLSLLFVWIAVTLVKMALMKKWWLVFVIGGTALLPAPAASGSPTYTIFVIFACTGALALSWSRAETRLAQWGDWIAVLPAAAAVVVFALIQSGADIPKLTSIARPVLAEREKTFQLEEIVRWLVQSEFARYEPVLLSSSGNPRTAPDAVERTHRPPTVQEYLSKYARHKRHGDPLPGKIVLIGFGGEEAPGGTLLYTAKATHAGPARVYLPPPR